MTNTPKTQSAFVPPGGVRILRRRCVVCGQKKPNTRKFWDFARDTPLALHTVCRRCDWKLAHKDEIAEAKRRYYAEHKDEIAEAKRRYYAEHKDEIAEAKRRYRDERSRRLLAGLRTVRTVEERAFTLRTLYGARSVDEALGIGVAP